MPILSLFLLISLGYLLVTAICPVTTSKERCVLAFPFGLATTTLMMWVILSFNFPLTLLGLISMQGIMVFGLLYFAQGLNLFESPQFRVMKTKCYITVISILILFSVSWFFNLTFPIFVSDGIGYKFYGKIAVLKQSLLYFRDHIFAIKDENRTLGFHMISGYAQLINLERPKLVQSIFYICFVILFYLGIINFATKFSAKMFTLLFATSPMIWWQSFLYLNNLSAGFYFFCGVLFWFYSISGRDLKFLLISSFSFMLSFWVRYEFIIFYGIFLMATCYWALIQKKFISICYLISFPLVFSGLWALYSLTFHSEGEYAIFFGFVFGFYFLTFIVFSSFYKNKVDSKFLNLIFCLVIGGCFLLIALNGSVIGGAKLILTAFYSKVIWNILNQSVWGFSVLLIFVIPFYYKNLTSDQKYLFHCLIVLYFGISFVLALILKNSTLLHGSILDKVKFFIESPGRIAIRTSSREFFVFFPSLLFFLGTCMKWHNTASGYLRLASKLFVSHPIFNGFNFLILGNLIIIGNLFFTPRFMFLKDNFGISYNAMKITTGPKDNRNIFGPTYIISQAISKLTPENATIIFPYPYEALKNERKPYDSLGVIVAHDVLFPRVLFWEGFEDRLHLHSQKDLYAHQLRAIKKAKEGLVKYEQGKGKQKIFEKNSLYRVTYDGWHDNRCKYHEKGKSLEYLNWYICPED